MIGTKKQAINWLLEKNKDKLYEVKEYVPKRGLKANAYYWELVNQLGNILSVNKEELHFLLLQRYGQSEIVSVLEPINVKPYFKYYIEVGKSVLNGKTFKHYKVYKGSSEMTKKEMAILIEGLVSECQEVGIEIKSKKEIETLLESWDNKWIS